MSANTRRGTCHAGRREEAKRIGGLLSHVPAEMDVGGHIVHVYDAHFRTVREKRAEAEREDVAAIAALVVAGSKKAD